MENKNTKELRGYKAGLKSKLMGAVAMLLVSAIMVSSATYAWFVLSTHPEVKGMSTTVGSNGALEIALLNNTTGKDLSQIPTNVGDSSSATGKNAVAANVTWGNIVDLNDASYGLNNITLYPAVLNYDNTSNQVNSRTALLSYAAYGTDGRVSGLKRDTAAGLYAGASGFVSDAQGYGVRAIGTVTNANPIKHAFAEAVEGYDKYAGIAVSTANAAFNGNLEKLVSIAITHSSTGEGVLETYTADQYACINTALTGLQNAATAMETALQYAVAASINSKATQESDLTTYDKVELDKVVDTNYATHIANLTALQNSIKAEQDKMNTLSGTVEWDKIEAPYKALMGNKVTILADGEEVITTGKTAVQLGQELRGKTLQVTVSSGLFKTTADFTGTMTGTLKLLGLVDATGTVEANDPTVKTSVDGIVHKYSEPAGSGASNDIITTAYGYAVDLAFKTNASGNQLRLQGITGVNRVGGDATDNGTMGGGTSYTFTDGTSLADMKKIAKALRVVFMDKDEKVVAVAAIDQAADAIKADTYKYALHIYAPTFTKNGGITLGAAVADDAIMTLEQDTATALSTIVYLDGENVDYALNGVDGNAGIVGTLNLQFCGSANLTPMTYDFNAAAGGGDAGQDGN